MFKKAKLRVIDGVAGVFTRVGMFQHSAWNVLSDLGVALLSPEELERYTLASYGAKSLYSTDRSFQEQGLFEWEERLIAESFPARPARILVAACGGGREVLPLLERGYEIVAFDPVEGFVRALARRAGSLQAHLEAGCLGFSGLVSGGERGGFQVEGPFDAVVVGWGALAHILRPEDVVALLVRLRALAPVGPVLASFFVPVHGSTTHGARRTGLRRLLTRVTGRSFADDRLSFQALAGAMRYYDKADLHRLAKQAGYDVEHYEEVSGAARAVLRPCS